jgi:flagellar hook-length control protein FliK
MVAAANLEQGSAVSRRAHSAETLGEAQASGGAKHAKGAKKSALGVFAKLLAGLRRKAGAGGEGAGEIETEGLGGTEKSVRGAKNAAGKDAAGKHAELPGEKIPLPGGEKIQNRDRRFLAALKGEGEVLSPGAKAEEGPVKKAKQPREGLEGEESALLAAAGALTGDEPLPEGPQNEVAPGLSAAASTASEMQDSLIRPAEAEDRAAAGLRVFRESGGEGAAPAANAEVKPQTAGMVREKPGAEKKEGAVTTESKNARKNRERFALEVRDLRTAGVAAEAGQGTANGLEAGAEPAAEIVVDLRNDGGSRELPQPGREKTAGQAFEDILARELHQNLNGDIVRQASILVKDGGEGTIRLSLKPESLGMVKVRLEMAENKITGHIIVESSEALRAFEREIHSLEQAFRDSGFAGASLDMALAGDGGRDSREQREAAQALFSIRAVSSGYDAAAETVDLFAAEGGFDGPAGRGFSRINVLA